MPDIDMRRWALKGAEHRLVEIAEEASKIYAAFPELRDSRSPGAGSNLGPAAAPRHKRRRFRMSAEAKARIADAIERGWQVVVPRQSVMLDGAAVTTLVLDVTVG